MENDFTSFIGQKKKNTEPEWLKEMQGHNNCVI